MKTPRSSGGAGLGRWPAGLRLAAFISIRYPLFTTAAAGAGSSSLVSGIWSLQVVAVKLQSCDDAAGSCPWLREKAE
jgi:hypothetical protein